MAFWCTYLSCKWTRDYCWVKNTFITSYSSYYAAQNKWEEIFWLSNFQREKSHSFYTKTLLDDWHLEHFQCLDEQDTPPNWIIATNNEQDWKISGSLVPETTSWCTVSTYKNASWAYLWCMWWCQVIWLPQKCWRVFIFENVWTAQGLLTWVYYSWQCPAGVKTKQRRQIA